MYAASSLDTLGAKSSFSLQSPSSLSIAAALTTRVWTQFSQHLMAKMWSMDRKLAFNFSYRVVSRRMSFILQKNRSTRLRMA